MSSITDLVEAIKAEAVKSINSSKDERLPLEDIFEKSLRQTLREIKFGADSRNFPELVIINFIISSSKNGYEAYEIRDVLESISPTGFTDSFPPLEELEIEL